MVTRYEDKEYVLDKELKDIDESTVTLEESLTLGHMRERCYQGGMYHVGHNDS